jgi:ATP-dependent DNA ligase
VHCCEKSNPATAVFKSCQNADTTWVEPRFDAEIAYAEITDDGMARHPSFKRLGPRGT